ncbi:MAG: hypothetical protein ACK5IC_02665 [Moheibacter sp.]
MKYRITILLCLIITSLAHSQIYSINGTVIRTNSTADKVNGSPYIDDKYREAKVSGADNLVELRYNVYGDQMEYKVGNLVYSMNKATHPEVNFQQLNKKYIYTNYTDEKNTLASGYLLVKFGGETASLYQKESIIFVPRKEATSSYEQSKSAEYKLQAPKYFFKYKSDEIKQVITNKKKFVVLFGEDEAKVKNYIKSEKINLSNELDLVKLFKLLNTL